MTTADPNRALALQWLALAEENLAVAEATLGRAEPLVRPALFHCQQAGEKAIKAVLVASGRLPPRTHDVATLLDLALDTAGGLDAIRDDAERLTIYGVEPRYPEVGRTYTDEEARAALDAARRVADTVKRELR